MRRCATEMKFPRATGLIAGALTDSFALRVILSAIEGFPPLLKER